MHFLPLKTVMLFNYFLDKQHTSPWQTQSPSSPATHNLLNIWERPPSSQCFIFIAKLLGRFTLHWKKNHVNIQSDVYTAQPVLFPLQVSSLLMHSNSAAVHRDRQTMACPRQPGPTSLDAGNRTDGSKWQLHSVRLHPS